MLILCCGNADRGDDAAGTLVAKHLRAMDLDARLHSAEALSLLQSMRTSNDVIIVDTVKTGEPAGTISVWDGRTAELASHWFRCSTRGLSVAEAVGMARNLNCLPKRLRIYGIEGHNLEPGTRPLPVVSRAAEQVAQLIQRESIDALFANIPSEVGA